MAKQTWVAGNWKMNHGPAEAAAFFDDLEASWSGSVSDRAQARIEDGQLNVALFVPSVSLSTAATRAGRCGIQTGAQNAHGKPNGAFTGEVSGPMLKELGVRLALVGHSERRTLFGETDEGVKARAEGLLGQGFTVMICVGETRAQFERGETADVIRRQLIGSVPQDIPGGKILIAYEPVWAIGTGLVAQKEQIQEAHDKISRVCPGKPILYGGSVTPENLPEILTVENVSGVLVGGASLKPASFLKLVQLAG